MLAPWSGSMRIAVQVEAVAGPGAQVASGHKPGRQRVAVAAAGTGPPTQIPKSAKSASTLQMLGGPAACLHGMHMLPPPFYGDLSALASKVDVRLPWAVRQACTELVQMSPCREGNRWQPAV